MEKSHFYRMSRIQNNQEMCNQGMFIIYGEGGGVAGKWDGGGKRSLLPYLGGGGGQKGFTLDLGKRVGEK